MTKRTIPMIMAIILSSVWSVAYAENVTIILKNGTSMKGTIVSESGNFLSINNNGSKVNVLKSIIATINGEPYPPDALPVPAAAVPEPAATVDNKAVQVEITMQDGTVFKGTLISENVNFMNINTGSAEVKVLKSNIAGSKRSITTPTTTASKPIQTTTAPISRPTPPAVAQPASPVIEMPQAPAIASVEKSVSAQNQPNTAPGDHSVILKNGTQFKGPIIAESANFIAFNINGSKVNILKSIISSLDGSPYSPTQPASAPLQTPQTPILAPAAATTPTSPAPSAAASATPAPPSAAATQTPTPPTQPRIAPAAKPEPVASAVPVQAVPSHGVKYGPTAPLMPAGSSKPASGTSAQMPSAAQSVVIDTKTAAVRPLETAKPLPAQPAPIPFKPAVTKTEQTPTLPPVSPQVQDQTRKLAAQEREKQVQAALQLKAMGPSASSAIPQLIEMLGSEVQQINLKESTTKKSATGIMTPAKAATEALISIGSASIEPLINALSIRNYGVRACACFALGELKDSRSVDGLVIALKDSFPEVRMNASEALGKIRDPRAIPLLVTMLGEDNSEDVRNATQVSLNNLTDIPALIASLKDPSNLVRENVAYILFLMTAKDFRADPSQWEGWWKEQQDGEKK